MKSFLMVAVNRKPSIPMVGSALIVSIKNKLTTRIAKKRKDSFSLIFIGLQINNKIKVII